MTVTHLHVPDVEPGSRVADLVGDLVRSMAEAIAAREDRDAALAMAYTPVPYRCRLEWAEVHDRYPQTGGLRVRRFMSCRWGR